MDKRLSERILQHCDFPTMEVLKDYVTQRSADIHFLMETSMDSNEWRKLQGEIIALKNLLKIRDYAAAIIERDRNG